MLYEKTNTQKQEYLKPLIVRERNPETEIIIYDYLDPNDVTSKIANVYTANELFDSFGNTLTE